MITRLGPTFVVLLAASAACAPAPSPTVPALPPTTATASSSMTSDAVPAPRSPNPFLGASSLPFEAPPFDRITDADYRPAFDAGMAQHLAEIDAIVSQHDAPSFANTIERLERSGRVLDRVSRVFDAITGANTDDALQKLDAELAPLRAAHQDAIFMNEPLFARVTAVYSQRDGLDPEARVVTERYYRDFVRAGARLPEAAQAELRALNAEESTLQAQFRDKVRTAGNEAAVAIKDKTELAGLDGDQLAAAAKAASDRKLDGQWLLTLRNTTQQPLQVSLQDRATRERLFRASVERAERGDANDTRAIVQRLAALRARKAQLLGFENWASYRVDPQMAHTPARALALLTDMVPAAVAKAKSEASRMQALADGRKDKIRLEPFDWQFYAEQVRKELFNLDTAQVRQYLELNRVLRDGVFFAAERLYGVTFRERTDLPVYHPDVRTFEVFDEDGRAIGLVYADYFKRDAKSGGAWMNELVSQSGLLGTRAVVSNVCNFTKPSVGQPALLDFDDVTAMFHEFGHALHGIFSNVKYPRVAGTNVPRDLVEFPSQFNENWATDPAVFANYAKHYQTGEPMPRKLAEQIRNARHFNQGFMTTEALAAGLLDLAWHTLPAEHAPVDVDAFEADALKRFGLDYALVPPRYRTTYFLHIWEGGYSGSYYAYMWSEMLDHDAFEWFTEHGGLTRANGQRLRDMILSRGDTQDAASMYRAFRGRDPAVKALLEYRGLSR